MNSAEVWYRSDGSVCNLVSLSFFLEAVCFNLFKVSGH